MKLTQANAERLTLPVGARDKIFFDDDLPGFGLRLRDGGKRSWIAQYRVGAKQRRVSIGTVETTRADEARNRAKNILSKVYLGGDPQMEKAEARAQASATLRNLVERYLDERAANRLKPRSLQEVERHLRVLWSPVAELPVKRVTRADVAAQLGKIAKQNGPFAANRARASLSALFSWAIGEGLCDANPVVGTNRPTEEIRRERVLTDPELGAVWGAAGIGDYAAIVRLLILTGQRREEVGGMPWSEIDTERARWRIGAERNKNGLAHEVPLSAPALGVLRGLELREGRDLVFGAGDGPFQGWSNAKGVSTPVCRPHSAYASTLALARYPPHGRYPHGRPRRPTARHRSRYQPYQRPQGGGRGRLQSRKLRGEKRRASTFGRSMLPRWSKGARAKSSRWRRAQADLMPAYPDPPAAARQILENDWSYLHVLDPLGWAKEIARLDWRSAPKAEKEEWCPGWGDRNDYQRPIDDYPVAWIPSRSATRLREADLNVLSKLSNQGLEWRLEPEAFSGGEVRREDDLLDVLVGCPVDIQVARQPST